jgi:hypothetical protein
MTIRFAESSKLTARVIDATGRIVKTVRFTGTYELDMSGWSSGVYVVEVMNERTGGKVRKVIIKN